MKIMFCIGSMTQGGAERVVANLANEISNKNDVLIVSTIVGKSFYEISENIKYYTLDSGMPKRNIFSRTLSRTMKLRKILKEEKPDIVLCFLPEPTFRLLIAKIFLNVKTIISVRNDPNVLYNSLIKKLIVKVLYPNADGYVFQTEDARRWFSNKIQVKSQVIPNPINDKFICRPYDDIREKSIVCVARLVKQKNHKMLINAFSKVLKKHPDYILKLYGDGPCRDDLIEQIDELNIKSKVFIMGEVSDIKTEIYKSSIFVLPSDYEGMPNALMEAMALGLPCISTDCPIGGPKFLIKNGENGLLINVGDEIMLEKSINMLIEDEKFAKHIGENANEICIKLSPKIINKKWEKYIMEVVNEKK